MTGRVFCDKVDSINFIDTLPDLDASSNMFNPKDISQFTDIYFDKSKTAAVYAKLNPRVVWQVFNKRQSVFCGLRFIQPMLELVDEAWTLRDGDDLAPQEPAMILKSNFQDFVQFETVYLGILARCTRIATNVREAVVAADGKPVLFFPARFDVPETQYYDGYAAAVGGAFGCATQEQTDGFNLTTGLCSHSKPVGTMPHALIAAFAGDTVAASLAFAESHPDEKVWALVDFHNHCAQTAVEVALAFRDKGMLDRLAGVRLDTSEKLTDIGIANMNEYLAGVNPALVFHVRRELNLIGSPSVRICVSGGFTPDKIRHFEEVGAPADVYAIGEGFLRGESTAFTSDIVARFEGNNLVPCGKVGRELRSSTRLKLYAQRAVIG